jgi:hypothetical protein
MSLTVAWRDVTGQARTTDVTVVGASGPHPYVVMLHGASGNEMDMTIPGNGPHAGALFDVHTPVPAVIDRGWHPYPGVGYWSIARTDPPWTVPGWGPVLNAAGYVTAVYSQADPAGPLANATLELHAVTDALAATMPGRGMVFLADSRGGLLARRWIADIPEGDARRGIVRALVTLHSPHQGTALANRADEVRDALHLAASPFPALAPLLATIDNVLTADLTEMAIGSAFLARLEHDETSNHSAACPAFTFGGTSTQLVRVRNWPFTADSAKPVVKSVIPPTLQFHWRTANQELISFADDVSGLAALGDELRDGVGDLLVTDARARLPWARQHITNALSHADSLTSPVLCDQVRGILNGLAP